MAIFGWKERGYVPDSDEEEDFEAEFPSRPQSLEEDAENHVAPSNASERTSDLRHSRDDAFVTFEKSSEDSVGKTIVESPNAPRSPQNASAIRNDKGEFPLGTRRSAGIALDSEEYAATEDSPLSSALSSVVDELQAELESGLQTIEEILHPPREKVQNIVGPKGHMTKAESLAAGEQQVYQTNSTHTNTQRQDENRTGLDQHWEDAGLPSASSLVALHEQPTRSLRRRKPVQLRPYGIEDSIYRQSLKASGLRPQRIVSPERRRSSSPLESQGKDFLSLRTPRQRRNSNFQACSEYSFAPKCRNRSAESVHSNTSSPKDNEGNHLLDLEVLLQDERSPQDPPTRKRRYRDESLPSRESRLIPHIDDSGISNFPFDKGSATNDGSFHEARKPPLSPPRSGSNAHNKSSEAGSPVFRFPRGLTPPKPLTPVASSSTGHGVIERSQASLNAVHSASLEEHESSSSGLPSSQDHEQEQDQHKYQEEAHLRKLARKMHGVLPAAFLRLNSNAQTIPRPSSAPSRSSARRKPGKARLTQRTNSQENECRNSEGEQISVLSLSDDSPSDVEEQSRIDYYENRARSPDLDGGIFQMDTFDEEPLEDNTEIDFMVSERKRPRLSSDQARKRQKRLDDVWEHENWAMTSTWLSSSSHAPVTKQRRHQVVTLPRPRPPQQKSNYNDRTHRPKLGILDSPDVTRRQRQDQPLFLRVAVRRAHNQKGNGRKHPRYKQIQLPTAQDNRDASAMLSDWHAGRIALDPAIEPALVPTHRQALLEVSNIQQHRQPSSSSQDASGHPGTVDAPEKSSPNSIRRSSNLVEPTNKNSPMLFPRQQKDSKRSKKRQLLTNFGAIRQPRAAQIEQDKSSRQHKRSLKTALSALKSNLLERHVAPVSTTVNLQQLVEPRSKDNSNASPKSTSHGFAPSTGKVPQSRRARKRAPRRYSISTDYQGDKDIRGYEVKSEIDNSPFLQTNDLLAFEDLNTSQLRAGNAFDLTTYIGSGRFSRILNEGFVRASEASASGSGAKATTEQVSRTVSPSNGAAALVASTLTSLCNDWDDLMLSKENVDHTGLQVKQIEVMKSKLVTVVDYVAYQIESEDTSIQIQCIQEVLKHMTDFLKRLESITKLNASYRTLCLGVVSRSTLLTFKIWQFGRILDGNSEMFRHADSQLRNATLTTLAFLLEPNTIESLRNRSREISKHMEYKINAEDMEIESLVIINNIFRQCKSFNGFGSIWDYIREVLPNANVPSGMRVADCERIWKGLFAVLPFLELDESGHRPDQMQHSEDVSLWELVRSLLQPTLAIQTSPVTDILYYRCYRLVASWGWIITPDVLNSMIEMSLEEVCQLPALMLTDSLDDIGAFCRSHAQQGESCGAIILKLIAWSIYMRYEDESTSTRSASSLIAKIIPTQSHEAPPVISQKYIASVRRQYDILSVIYVSAPESSKPTLRQFKRLVNMQKSSAEVYQIGIRICKRMIGYDVKLDHQTVGFAGWLDEILLDILRHWKPEHRTDRTPDAWPAVSSNSLPDEHLLTYGLLTVQALVTKCSHGNQVVKLIPRAALSQLFRLSLQEEAFQEIVPIAINLIQEIVAWPRSESQPLSKETEDDSQDYGNVEWAAIDEGSENGHASVLGYILGEFYLPLKRLLSSALRSESNISRTNCEVLVKCWAAVAHSLVREGLREWSAYFEPHADDSWSHFEDCTRTTDGMILFLSEVIKSNPHFISGQLQTVLKSYISGMIDLNDKSLNLAILRRQILDVSSITDEILQSISPGQTRLESVTTMIINMQQICHASGGVDLNTGRCKLVSELGRHLIQAMIKSWRSSKHETMLIAQRKVDFYSGVVHALLIYLPEYAPQLEFFTKGHQFPYKDTAIFVKVHDYARQQSEGKNVGKALITYLHGLLENAAANSGADDLVTQLVLAMGLNLLTNDLSDDRIRHAEKVRNGAAVPLVSAPLPTTIKTKQAQQLRFFLLGKVFPSYISTAFTSTGRFLVMPVVGALVRAYEALRLYSSHWEDIARLHQITRELLEICHRTILASPLRDNSATMTGAERREFERIGRDLQEFIDLAEMTVEYMERVCEEEAAEAGEDNDVGGGGGGGVGRRRVVNLSAYVGPVMTQETDLSRYIDRTIEDWKRQVVCRQGFYYIRDKCIGEA